MTWLIIVAIVVVLVVGAVVYMQRRSATLKDRFGPEYDRAVEEAGDRRAAESQLRDRAKRHDALELQELSPEALERYSGHWQQVQVRFVDDPAGTVVEADELVAHVMRERGYPVDEWEERFEMVSVDHPELADNYRVAHAIHERSTTEDVPLDDLREAFQRYRSLFNELLEDGNGHTDADDDVDVDADVDDDDALPATELHAEAEADADARAELERDDADVTRGERL